MARWTFGGDRENMAGKPIDGPRRHEEHHLKRAKHQRLPPRRGYRRWSESYASTGHNPLTLLAEAMVDALRPDWAGQAVLDLACGVGRWSRIALDAGASSCIGLDFVAEMLAAARRSMPHLPVAAGDLRSLPLRSQAFDRVVLSLGLSHLPLPREALGEASRVLRPGGRFLLVDLHPRFEALGLQRSFRDAHGEALHLRWHPHTPERIAQHCADRGLEIESRIERGLGRAALAPGAPADLAGQPLLYALSARKP